MKRRRGWWWMVMVDWKGGKEGRKGRWTVANRTPPPLLVAIRPVFPDRSSAAGFDAIAGGIVIGCQMRARPPLNLANLRHHGIGMALGRWDSGNEILRRLETLPISPRPLGVAKRSVELAALITRFNLPPLIFPDYRSAEPWTLDGL